VTKRKVKLHELLTKGRRAVEPQRPSLWTYRLAEGQRPRTMTTSASSVLCLIFTVAGLTAVPRTGMPVDFSRRVHGPLQLLAQVMPGNGVGKIAFNVQAILDLTDCHIPARLRKFESALDGVRICSHRSTNQMPPSRCWPSGQCQEEAQRLPERKRILSALCKFQRETLTPAAALVHVGNRV
jgi:hypothetical protein